MVYGVWYMYFYLMLYSVIKVTGLDLRNRVTD